MSLLLRIDVVQRRLGEYVAEELKSTYGIPLKIGGIRIRHLDEIIIKDILVTSPEGDTILHSNEGTAHISPSRMSQGQIQINTLLFSKPDIRINRKTQGAPLNIQFIIDNLDKNKNNDNSNISVRVNQFLAYDGKFSYDILDIEEEHDRFDKNHITIDNLSCNISIKKLNKEQADIIVRSLSGKEKSGLELVKLRSKARITKEKTILQNMELQLPNSHITSDILSIAPDTQSPNQPTIAGDLKSSRFSIDDIKPFLKKREFEIPELAFSVSGKINKKESDTEISLNTTDNKISINANVNIESIYDKETRLSNVHINNSTITEEGYEHLLSFISKRDYAMLKKLGDCNINAEINLDQHKLWGTSHIESEAGALDADITFDKKERFFIKAAGKKFRLERITGISGLESCDIETRINGNALNWGKTIEIGGQITGLTAKNYTYAPIDFTSSIDENKVRVHITTDDPNLKSTLKLSYMPEPGNRADVTLIVDSIIPAKLNLADSDDNIFSFTLKGEYNNFGKGNSVVNAKVQNLIVKNDAGTREIRNLHIYDNNSTEQHILILNSDIVNCNVTGKFQYERLFKGIRNMLSRHILNNKEEDTQTIAGDDDYTFKLNIRQSKMVSEIFNLPVTINETSTIEGKCNDKEGVFKFKANINNVSIAESIYRLIEIEGNSDKKGISLEMKGIKPIIRNKSQFDYNNTDNDLTINMNSLMRNDTITSHILWANNNKRKKMKGSLSINAALEQMINGIPYITASISPDSIIHNDSLWFVSAGSVKGNLERIEIEDLNLYNKDQVLKVYGIASKDSSDVLSIEAQNIEIATIFDLINFKKLKMSGNASGKARITSALNNPSASGTFDIGRFYINSCPMGDAETNISWEDRSKAIIIDAKLNNAKDTSRINGFLSQEQDSVEIKINANSLNVGFLNRYLDSFISDIQGTCNGNVYLRGSWRDMDLYGALSLNCNTRVNATNTRYTLVNDSVRFSSGTITFDNSHLTDYRGYKGRMDGTVNHHNLSEWTCDLRFNCDNMLVYDTRYFDNLPFYGTIYASGNGRLVSNKEGLFLSADLSNGNNSSLVYNSGDVGDVRDNSFVTFIDSKKKGNNKDESNDRIKRNISKLLSRLNLNFKLDINDRMQIRVYTDLQSDDYIELYGNGPMHAIYDGHDGFTMKGTLDLNRGAYQLSAKNFFPKEFSIIKGSSLHFNGNPFEAKLDLKTKHPVFSARLSELSPDIKNNSNITVNCLMNISGTLQSPELSFDIELPEASEEEKEILASAISTPEQKNMQFMYLIGVGKFYTYDYNTAQNEDTQSSTAVESFISNTISGQLNNMLGHIINSDNWDISGNFSTSERGWNSMEVEGMLSGRLLNNRLLINGNFGYRENPIASNSFVGTFEVQWLLTPRGTVSLRAYSKTNDRYFSKTNLTTQGAGIILRHDFNSLRWWAKKKENKKEKKKDDDKRIRKNKKERKAATKEVDKEQPLYEFR